jgi:hypothetical protein
MEKNNQQGAYTSDDDTIDPLQLPPQPSKAITSLFQAAFQIAKQTSSLPIDPNILSFQYNTRDIISLLCKINPKGVVTFEELRSYPKYNLNPIQSEILEFLTKDIRFFNRFARLAQPTDKLSADDIRIAAQLAGDALMLTDEDLAYLSEPKPSQHIQGDANPAARPAIRAPQVLEE